MVSGVCYIVGAGELFGSFEASPSDIILAADGGLDHLAALGKTPDAVIGDMDSIGALPDNLPSVRYPVRKDYTDSYLAYQYGRQKGYTKFVIFGGTGGREDHTFANYCLLIDAKMHGDDIILMGENTKTYALANEKKIIRGNPGATVSVFAFGAAARGVSIRGLTYEAENVTLSPEFPLGVSNSFSDTGTGEIEVREGSLLVMEQI